MSATPKKILIVQPSWVGDAVMATPALRAIRELYPQAHIAYMMKRYVKPLYTGLPWADQLITYRSGKTKKKAGKGLFDLAGRIRGAKFDLAILLPNSFQTALVCKMANIPRVVGYERDGRGFLLSDKLLPRKEKGKFVPTPIVRYYMGLAHYLGSTHRDYTLKLFITDSERREAADVMERAGLSRDVERPGAAGKPPMILLNPGAQFGSSKCWPAKYFAQLADQLVEELGATILISGAPREKATVETISRAMRHAPVDLLSKGSSLGTLKEIIRRCDLVITNDTGPRHIAAAFDVPVITLFGPTHPEWTEIDFAKERKLAVKVFCGPCQKKTCPLDHRCMTLLTPAMVHEAAVHALSATIGVPPTAPTQA
jgi:heptosyltransferase-2